MSSNLDNIRTDKESYLHSISIAGTTELIHGLLGLERVTNTDGTFARLPPPNYSLLPRSKPLPKPKPLTRWEKFAKTRGIVKTKNSRKVFDEATKEYRPAFGYGSKTVEKDWIMEVPANAPDQTEDQFEKKANEKKERIATNAKRQKRNQEEAQLTLSGKDIRSAKKKAVEKKLVETKVCFLLPCWMYHMEYLNTV